MKTIALSFLAVSLAGISWAQQPVIRDLSCSATSGSGTTYTCAIAVAPSGYVSGQQYRFKADTGNTSAATINFNALGAVAIKKMTGSITTALVAGDINAGQWVYLTYDGTNMQMESQLGNASAGGGGISSIAFSSPLTGGTITSSGTAGCQTASGSQAGCLSAADWTTFNSKQSTLTLPLSVGNGGTGTASPGLVAGTNITVTGSWPNQTVTASATAATAFSALTGSTNTSAAMVVGSGASLGVSGSGTIAATSVPGGGITGSNSIPAGTLPLATSAAFGAVKCDGSTITCTAGVIASVASGMVYPGTGIANSTGSAWGTSYTTTGSGTVLALATSPTLVTPNLGTPSTLVLSNATGLPGGQIVGANSIPATTLPLATTGAFGAVKCDGTTISCTAGVIAALGSGNFYQTFQANGTPVTQRANFNLVAGPNISVTPSDSGTTTTFTIAGTSGTSIQSAGVLASIPATCTPGTGIYQYFATDQPPGQQLYQCSSTNTWTQIVNLGGSGALAYTGGALDINSTFVPLKNAANTFAGFMTLTGGMTEGSETVSFSGTPTFSSTLGNSTITLTAAITAFTLAAGTNGQEKVINFCQNGTGGFAVAPPSNVHGMSIGTTASKCSVWVGRYNTVQSAWLSLGVNNQ